MSYCRFSCDDWRSDVYCYESRSGFEIYVASSRFNPLPDRVTASMEDSERYLAQYKKQMDQIEGGNRDEIGLKYDGEHFCLSTEEDMVAMLKELSLVGYNIPEWMFKL